MAEQYVGVTFRQLSHRLRISRPGQPDRISERPRDPKSLRYQDSDATPTLVSFEAGDQVDVEQLLRIGAIVPYMPPKLAKGKEVVGDVR